MLDFLLLKSARILAALFRKIQRSMIMRFLNGARCVVWEIPNNEPHKTKALVSVLTSTFPKGSALKKLLLLVSDAKNNSDAFVIAAFDPLAWHHIADTVNNIPIVTQTFISSPEGLLSMAIQGKYYMAYSNVTPKTVDNLYGRSTRT